ncbi:SDR family oxidoreductase [Lysobacter humi (ex Lee et al. 2017)]
MSHDVAPAPTPPRALRVLVTGATGFIGGAVVEALLARGHVPVPAVRDVDAAKRRWPQLEPIACDFLRDVEPDAWRPRLAGIDAVVNAVGILRESGGASFDALHSAAPRALFAACADAGVRRIVQVSALGADAQATSRYHGSKRAADDAVLALPVEGVVIQPSVVFAPGGASAAAFLAMASLPVLALPGGGVQRLAPVHRDDVVEAILRALEHPAPPARIEAVGPACMALRDYLARLRRQLGGGALRVLPVPMPLVRQAARVMARVPGSIVDPETIAMLERGNCAAAGPFASFLGRMPRAVEAFVTPAEAPMLRREAQLRVLLPAARLALAIVFVVTGLLSLGLYPLDASRALLARAGLHGLAADVALFGGAAIDIALGLGLLAPRRWRRPAYLASIALVLSYTAIISIALPEFWRHPFGPVLKNLPILVLLWMLHALDRR